MTEMDKPSEKQIALMDKYKIPYDSTTNISQASKLIESFFAVRNKDKPTNGPVKTEACKCQCGNLHLKAI